jgi:hypothetical protein
VAHPLRDERADQPARSKPSGSSSYVRRIRTRSALASLYQRIGARLGHEALPSITGMKRERLIAPAPEPLRSAATHR